MLQYYNENLFHLINLLVVLEENEFQAFLMDYQNKIKFVTFNLGKHLTISFRHKTADNKQDNY